MQTVKTEKKELTITPQLCFSFLLGLLWCQNTIMPYVIQVLKRIPVFNLFADYVMPAVIIVGIVLSVPYMLQKIKWQDFLFYISAVLIVLFFMIFDQKNSQYIEKEAYRIIVTVLPFFFIGLCFDLKKNEKLLFWLSLLGCATVFLYQFYCLYLGRELLHDNMNSAYNVLPSLCFLIYYAFLHKKIKFWLIAILFCLLEFLFGTRGPILCLAVFFLGGLYLTVISKKSVIKKLIILFLFLLIVLAFFFTNLIDNIVHWFSLRFEEWGLSTRIFDYFIEGDIADDNGRDPLYESVITAIKNNLFGYGLMGDRYILDGSYVHNIFLEIWCQFGVILGSGILISLFVVLLKPLFLRIDVENKLFIFMFISMVIPKLMLTGSYLHESNLFFLLGMCVSLIRQKRKI